MKRSRFAVVRKTLRSPLIYRILEIIFLPFTFLGAIWFRIAKYIGLSNLFLTRKILFKAGVFPIVDNYYEPLFRFDQISFYEGPRDLQIDWNIEEQLAIVSQFTYQNELAKIPIYKPQEDSMDFYHENGSYGGYDAEYLYSIIRLRKPKRIIEIGSGFSTRLACLAVAQNRTENKQHSTDILCIEPYEMPWLEKIGVKVIRDKVENLPVTLFETLEKGDMLFIDSSHIIRPGGDVLFELFTILPSLKPGVLIHVHDIFSPFDYPKHWLTKEFRLWNEQYILEAFLMYNSKFKIIGALSYLGYKFPELAKEKFYYCNISGRLRGCSMWIEKLD